MRGTLRLTDNPVFQLPMPARFLLIDHNDYTASVLAGDLALRGYADVVRISGGERLPGDLERNPPDVVIFNHHAEQPGQLEACRILRRRAASAAIVAIVSPGPVLKSVREWARQSGCIDTILEKPLSGERFFPVIDHLVKSRERMRRLERRSNSLERLVTEPALSTLECSSASGAQLFEAAVLFTDIRGSSHLIRTKPVQNFFQDLNDVLSLQSAEIVRHEGSVIKYTGDGLLAVYRGMGRAYLALRCAISMAERVGDYPLPFGIGVAEGLVMGGLIGDSRSSGQRQQYDVIGATVHLASRLCAMAASGEVIAPKSMNAVSRMRDPEPRSIGGVELRGFSGKIECVSFFVPPGGGATENKR